MLIHIFCHDCLDSHIKASTKSRPLGFACPLCREFITAPGVLGQCASDKWSEHFPINKLIVSLSGKCNDSIPPTVLCDVCKKDGNEETAINWCKDCDNTLCKKCSTMHNRFSSLQNHELISLYKQRSADVNPTSCLPLFCPSARSIFSVEITRCPYVPYVYQYCIGHVSISVPSRMKHLKT